MNKNYNKKKMIDDIVAQLNESLFRAETVFKNVITYINNFFKKTSQYALCQQKF